MPFAWGLPSSPVCAGKNRKTGGSACGGQPKAGGAAAARQYNARQPTSAEFSRNWSAIGQISSADKITALERSDDKFGRDALMQYAQQPDALDAMMWVATGWEPGLDLFEREREAFFLSFCRAHARRGYPLRNTTPEACIELVSQKFGHQAAPVGGLEQPAQAAEGGLQQLAPVNYFIDVVTDGTVFISDGNLARPLPQTGRAWKIINGIVTDGVYEYLPQGFFQQADDGELCDESAADS